MAENISNHQSIHQYIQTPHISSDLTFNQDHRQIETNRPIPSLEDIELNRPLGRPTFSKFDTALIGPPQIDCLTRQTISPEGTLLDSFIANPGIGVTTTMNQQEPSSSHGPPGYHYSPDPI